MFADRNDESTGEAGPVDALLTAAARADSRACARLAAVVDDLFLPADSRPDEHSRLAMRGLLARLVASVEDDLRQRLLSRLRADPRVHAALGTARIAIAAPILDDSGVLRDPALVEVLSARVGEHRLATLLRRPGPSGQAGAEERPEPLIDSGDPGVAEAAMALLVAESRRVDQFHQPHLGHADLPADLQHRLTWRVAAALRRWLVDLSGVAADAADAALVEVGRASLAGHDEGETVEAAAMRLGFELSRTCGGDQDAVIARALEEGRPALLAALVALRASVPFDIARDALLEADGARLAILLRAGGVGRSMALALLQAIADAHGQPMVDADVFERIDADRARAIALPWRVDPGYRAAVTELEGGLR